MRIGFVMRDTEMTLQEIKAEIASYPGPVSGCDAQYTWLLQERERLSNPGSGYVIIDRVNNDHLPQD